MDTGAVVIPPYVGRPLRLAPFHGVRLTPRRVGDPASGRLFARPYRAVAARLAQWQERGQLRRDDEPALYLHEYTAGGLTVRGLVGALDISHRASGPEDRAVLPHEGIHPVQADELADRMTELALNPAPILLVHRAPAEVRAIVHAVLAAAARRRLRGPQRAAAPGLGDPGPAAPGRASTRRWPSSQALIADGHHRYAAYLRMQRRSPGGPTDRGLAMLVDQEDTPLFLGPIHRILTGVSLDDLAAAAEVVGASLELVDRPAAVHALGPGHAGRHRRPTLGDAQAAAARGPGRRRAPPRRPGPGAAARPAADRVPPLGRGDPRPACARTASPC